ncbi:MAG: 50S ribosomal protein L24 [Candidatus Aminicenantes bacterium]|nr:50S ribosomal protein L24 [Candidatus Aminicenantes bacterium]MDH5714264.1 50S ribosomal protein L24 [Candidatus Aminicenantes bacterium]
MSKNEFIKKDDNVLVIAGKDKGKKGKVLRVSPKDSKAIVERINFVMKHTRANPSKNIKGGLLEREAPIHVSNLKIICRECGEPTRVSFTQLEDGKKVRICKKCKGILDKL